VSPMRVLSLVIKGTVPPITGMRDELEMSTVWQLYMELTKEVIAGTVVMTASILLVTTVSPEVTGVVAMGKGEKDGDLGGQRKIEKSEFF